MDDLKLHRHSSPVCYFHAAVPWPILLTNLSPGTKVNDLRAVLVNYAEIFHCFLLPSKTVPLGAIIHFVDLKSAAEDLDGTCADGFILQARLMSHKEQSSLTLLRRMS
jgi:hypothetical protein